MERYGCSNIKQIGQAEIERFFAELRAKGLSAGHITIYATAMRMLCRMLDKLQLVPDNRTLGCQRIKLKVRS
jgi:site-specific recombinase XerC